MLMLPIVFYSFTWSMNVFEITLRRVAENGLLSYILAMSMSLTVLTFVIIAITSTVIHLVMTLVRQKKWFGNIFGTIYILCIIVLLIMFWTSYFTFGWEESARHHFLNCWFYSFFLFGMFGIPLRIAENYAAYTKKYESDTLKL